MSISISCSKRRGLSEEMDVVAETGDEMMKWFGRAAVLLFFCCVAAMGAVRGKAAALTGSVVYQAVPDGETRTGSLTKICLLRCSPGAAGSGFPFL